VLEAKTISVSIPVPWRDLYEAIWSPESFPGWASGLSQSSLERDGNGWRAQGPEGPIRIRFTDHNPYGVMDHYVDTGSGPEIYVPMRVIPNAEGAEVILTVFRQPGWSGEKFTADVKWAGRDLLALKTLATGSR
jgi:hypothetical protein